MTKRHSPFPSCVVIMIAIAALSAASVASPTLFDCARRPLRVTPTGCRNLWEKSNDADSNVKAWEGAALCRHCPVGAGHAGRVHNATLSAAKEIQTNCTRCRRVASKMVGGRLCVSCYNRERELRRGYNRKGSFPKIIAATLHPRRIIMAKNGRAVVVERAISASVGELMLAEARTATFPLAFGWAVPA